MEEKKYLGMHRNVNFGLTWLCFIFGLVLLSIEHEKMDRHTAGLVAGSVRAGRNAGRTDPALGRGALFPAARSL